jgi:hypothetical protein
MVSIPMLQVTKVVRKKGSLDGKDTGDVQMYMQEVSGVFRFGSKSPHYADILKSKSWLSKDILDLQIKPKPIN